MQRFQHSENTAQKLIFIVLDTQWRAAMKIFADCRYLVVVWLGAATLQAVVVNRQLTVLLPKASFYSVT